MSMKYTALIPAYKPGKEFLPLLQELIEQFQQIIVVDDGSGERFRTLFQEAEQYAKVISYPVNHGKGYAMKTGLLYLEKNATSDKVIVTLDSDGQHTARDALRVAQQAEKFPSALILGVRSFGSDIPIRSRLGNIITRAVFHLSTGVSVQDTQTGLRAFSAELLPRFQKIEGNRYEYEMNVLLECPELGIPFHEVPIETVYFSGNSASHFQTVRDSFLVYKKFLKFALSSMTGFVVDYGLYSILVSLLGGLGPSGIPISNVFARIVSAIVNFSLNKHCVFKSKAGLLKTGAQYFLLAGCILMGNTLLLSLLVNVAGWNRYATKLLTEVTFFTLSFLGQRFWIFGWNQPNGNKQLDRTKKGD